MNIGTMVSVLLEEVHTAVSTSTQNNALTCIIEALRYNRTHETYFNKKKFYLTLVEDQPDYPLAIDYLGVIGKVKYHSDSTLTDERELLDGGIDLVERFQYIDEYDNSWATGEVSAYAVDDEGKRIIFGPAPASDGGVVSFRYIADLGTPTYTISGGTYTFLKPFSSDALTVTDTYSNKWLTEGQDATRCRAIYYWWSRAYGGTQEADIKAQKSLIQWQDAINALRAESSKRISNFQVRRWI